MTTVRDSQKASVERRRAALSFLSVCGAAAAALGLGALLPEILQPVAKAMLGMGLAVHLYAMFALRRLLAADGYKPSRLEDIGYYLCWLVILAIAGLLGVELVRSW